MDTSQKNCDADNIGI